MWGWALFFIRYGLVIGFNWCCVVVSSVVVFFFVLVLSLPHVPMLVRDACVVS